MKLSELKVGERAVILRVEGSGQFRKRILEMGFVQGKEVLAVQGAPLRDPMHYKILGYDVSLRLEDAAHIEVRLIANEAPKAEDVESLEPIAKPELPKGESAHMRALSHNDEAGALKRLRVALVGNPNCGKTSLFNYASGAHEHVGNYSGVTVEAKTGYFIYGGYRIELVDLPGAYSLSPYSPEELYIHNQLTQEETRPDIVLNVLDVNNLERNLYLSIQIKEMGLPMVAALNMFDEFVRSDEYLNYPKLSRLLGIPMIPTVCRTGLGLQPLLDEVISSWEGWHEGKEEFVNKETGRLRPLQVYYGSSLEPMIDKLFTKIKESLQISSETRARSLAIKLLEKDEPTEEELMRLYSKGAFILSNRDFLLKELSQELGEGLDTQELITDARYGFISGALRTTYRPSKKEHSTLTDKIDHWVTHRWLGLPIFLFLMFLMFETTFILGDYPMQWLEDLVAWIGEQVGSLMSDGPLKDLLVDGIINGVGGVIVFLPNILILYFFISVFEDTGYMARAAFIMDKLMHKMGLHGKSFIPLVMGFGCNVPAIMATRTIESHKSRMITMLVLPFMSCSARLPVYLLLVGALFPNSAGLVLFGIYLLGILIAVVSARLLRGTVFSGEDVPFVMELPPYRLPTSRSIFQHMWVRAKQYLNKMGTIILLASIIVWFLGYFPRQTEMETKLATQIEQIESGDLDRASKDELITEAEHEYHKYHQANSWIGQLGQFVEPAITPLGMDWKMGVSLLSGLAAKEIVVSTLGVIYTGDGDDGEEHTQVLSQRLLQEKRQDGSDSFTPLVALAFMVFVLVYFPCTATIIVIAKESGSWRWGILSVLYSCSLAWFLSFVVYQIGSAMGF